MSFQDKWNDVINKRERRKELEKKLTELKEDITFAELNKSKEDDHADSRLEILLQDLNSVERELDSLDNIEEEYQKVLQERIEAICNTDTEAKQFFTGVEKAIAGLDSEISQLNSQLTLLSKIKVQAEGMLKEMKKESFSKHLAKDFLKECQNLLGEVFGKKAKTDSDKEFSEIYIWELYQGLDEIDAEIKEKMQVLIPQIIELNMRREEYLNEYEA